MANKGPAKNRTNLVGKRFGSLLVIEDASNHIRPDGNKESIWKCQCDCGNIKVITDSNLRTGDAVNCGCYNHSGPVAAFFKHSAEGLAH